MRQLARSQQPTDVDEHIARKKAEQAFGPRRHERVCMSRESALYIVSAANDQIEAKVGHEIYSPNNFIPTIVLVGHSIHQNMKLRLEI